MVNYVFIPLGLREFLQSFTEYFPIFMAAISAVGLFLLVQVTRAFYSGNTSETRRLILGSSIVSLFLGLLVFPVEVIQMIQMFQILDQPNVSVSIVKGGSYLPFIPLAYGTVWFLVGIGGWFVLKRREEHQVIS